MIIKDITLLNLGLITKWLSSYIWLFQRSWNKALKKASSIQVLQFYITEMTQTSSSRTEWRAQHPNLWWSALLNSMTNHIPRGLLLAHTNRKILPPPSVLPGRQQAPHHPHPRPTLASPSPYLIPLPPSSFFHSFLSFVLWDAKRKRGTG